MQVLALLDAHPLWGGVNVWIGAQGDLVVQNVEQGGFEKRYSGRLPAELIEALQSRADALGSLPGSTRVGMPDESKFTLVVGDRRVTYWYEDGPAELESLRRELTQLAEGPLVLFWEGRHAQGREMPDGPEKSAR